MRPGDHIHPLERTITQTDMIAYGAATWDFHRLHYDPAVAARAGLDRPVVDGQMLGGLLAELVCRSLAAGQRLSRLHYRNTAPVLAGATVMCAATGPVRESDDGTLHVDLEVRVGDQVVVRGAGAEITTS